MLSQFLGRPVPAFRPRKARTERIRTAAIIADHSTAPWRSDHGRSSGRPVYSALCIPGPRLCLGRR